MKSRRQNSLGVLLRITAFRRMWIALSVSSLGDWLGLLATTALAAYLTKNSSNLIQGAAVSGVLLTRLLPDLVLSPIAGALVDRFDRRKVSIIGDSIAGLLYLSIAITSNLTWLLAAQFLVEAVGLFSNPAKQALWVNIVPRERLAVANQLNYVSVYGMVPVAAVVFALLATTAQFFGAPPVADAGAASALISGTSSVAINIALVLDAATYFLAAGVLFWTRHLIPPYLGDRPAAQSVFSLIREGVGFVKNSPVMRAIYVGILGAFGAGGLVAGVAQAYVATLGAGNAGYGILFGTVFSGLALGMLIGPKVLPAVPRRIVFTLCIGVAGCGLVVMSLLQDFVGAAVTSVVMGLFAGIAWITGFTMIGHEVSDRLRGRVFAFVMSSVRLTLLGTIAVGPILANSIGVHRLEAGTFKMVLSGPAIVLAASGLLTIAVSVFAGRQVGGLRGKRVRRVLRRVLQRPRGELLDVRESLPGVLVAVVGADSGATDRYAQALARHLDGDGWVVSVEVAGTGPDSRATAAGVLLEASGEVPVGAGDRSGDRGGAGVGGGSGGRAGDRGGVEVEDSPASALRALADLADLVSRRVQPVLEAGGVVICRDYVDAAVVRFGAQGGLSEERMIRLAGWATGGIRPDLTVLVDPLGHGVFSHGADRTVPAGTAAAAGDGPGGDDVAGGEQADDRQAGGREPVGGEPGEPVGGEPAGDLRAGGEPAADVAADDDEEQVDPRRVYQDLAASAPERYVSVPPLLDDEPVPAEIAERVASVLRSRSPIRRDQAQAGTAHGERDGAGADEGDGTGDGARDGDGHSDGGGAAPGAEDGAGAGAEDGVGADAPPNSRSDVADVADVTADRTADDRSDVTGIPAEPDPDGGRSLADRRA